MDGARMHARAQEEHADLGSASFRGRSDRELSHGGRGAPRALKESGADALAELGSANGRHVPVPEVPSGELPDGASEHQQAVIAP